LRRFLLIAVSAFSLMAVSGPDERRITDPKSISSASNPGAGPVSIDDLFVTRNVGGPAWSPDGKNIVFTTNLTGRNNLWRVSSAGAWPIQLSQSDDRQSGAVWSPDGKWILYQQDRGGGEIYDIFAIPSAGGEAVNLTHTDDISETAPEFSPDGQTVAFSWKPKTAPVPDIAVLDWQARKVRNLTKERAKDRLWGFVAWSPDGNSIYADRAYIGGTDADVYRIDAKTGDLEKPHASQRKYGVRRIVPLSRWPHATHHLEQNRLQQCCPPRYREQENNARDRHAMGRGRRKLRPERELIHLPRQSGWTDADLPCGP
jgi:hypothetical protein